ncbi:MAG: hypothetical protein HY079_07435 [Elusimicrobia bacterium]|nr:hypothetical protein [Elusimicrobiota bacterium]
MSVPPEEGLVRAWAYALALVVLCLPVYSPDLFWHLSAGRWIAAHLAVPRADAFSFTAFGAPWIDFEWGTQLAWYAVHAASGLAGLWLLKGVLLAAAFWPVDGLLRDEGASPAARAGALGLWLAAMLAQADLRADLVSACFFAVLLRRLSRGRASFLFGFGLFAVWANLHAGFPLGFVLYALAALSARLEERAPPPGLGAEAAGAALGALLNPYGAGLARALAAHASGPMARLVMEWGPPSAHRAFQLPLLGAMAVALAAALAARRRALSTAGLSALLLLAASAVSARFGAYFAAAGAAFAFSAFPRPAAAAVAAGLAAVSAALVVPLKTLPPGRVFDEVYVDRGAAGFVARERGALGGLRLFNQYEWGGYLGWALGPDGRVYGDGRYLFHEQLARTQDALSSPEAFAAFARAEALDGFLIRDYPRALPSTRVYPDGTTRAFARPWFVAYLPRERWALVWFDGRALVFVDRAKVPAAWLAAHEYRWLRPGDEAALADARARGEVPEAALAAEAVRHAAELAAR